MSKATFGKGTTRIFFRCTQAGAPHGGFVNAARLDKADVYAAGAFGLGVSWERFRAE